MQRLIRPTEISLMTLVVVFAASSLIACGGGEEDGSNVGGGDANGDGVPDDDLGGTLGSGNGTAGSGSGPGGNSVQVTPDGTIFNECVGESRQAEGFQLDMYVMFDHTASMGVDCPLNLDQPPSDNTKWCYATHALAQYFTSPSAGGHRAALQFLAVEGYTCDADPNNPEATPAVDLATLPVDGAHALVTALDTDDPVGGFGTPIGSGLHGIATYTARAREAGRTMIGVLITDGDPNECETDPDRLAEIPAAHLADTGIRTFVIGMTGATLDNLEPIARAGGAPEHTDHCDGPDSCHYWSVGNGDPATFVDALNQIQAAAVLPCAYQIPPPPSGSMLDYDLVNVTYTAADATERVFPGVASEGACQADTGGWYYDDAASPTAIHLCPSSCEVVTAGGLGADVHVAYGCGTVSDLR